MQPAPVAVIGEGGIQLNVWDYGGEGPPLVLCHCTGTFGRIWDPVVVHLRDTFHVLAIDTRGQGDSEAPQDRIQYEWWRSGDDVAAVAEHFDLPAPRYACGHSGGGAHVAYAELGQPGLFQKLLLIDPIIAPYHRFGEENPLAAKVRRRINTFSSRVEARERFASKPPMDRWSPVMRDAYVQHAFIDLPGGGITLKCPGDREAWFYELGGAHDVYQRLKEIRCPVMLVTGSDSYIAPLVEKQAAKLPACMMRTIAGAGHFVPQEQPETIAFLMKDWFS